VWNLEWKQVIDILTDSVWNNICMLCLRQSAAEMFGPKREEVIGGWRKLLNEELCNLCSSPNSIRMIKSRRMRWAEHVVHMGKATNVYRVLIRKPERESSLSDFRHFGERLILKWILE
jgi:hypothetical protein